MATSRAGLAWLAVLFAGLAAGCDRVRQPTISIEWTEFEEGRFRPLQFAGSADAAFTPVPSRTTGVLSAPTITERQRLGNRTLSHGTGVALGDIDGDGWVDLYVCRLDGANALYRNLGGWSFEDITDASGSALADRMSRGAVFADADGDGDLDLFVSVHGARNALLLNDGAGTFTEVDAGFAGAYGTTTLALADVDSDGDLDPYFANYKTIQGDDAFSPSERATRSIAEQVGDSIRVRERFRDFYRVQRFGERVRRYELADPDEFYLNEGDGRFSPVPFTAGVFLDGDGDPLDEAPLVWGLVSRFFDFDDDRDPDLYVANDFGSPDGIWRNDGGRFTAVGALAVRTTSASSMGVDFADIDRDGDTDFVTTEMLALDPTRRRTQTPSSAPVETPAGLTASRVSEGRNMLQLNRGDGTFAEVGRAAGLHASEWTWGAMFLDADLDGYEDFLVTNGHAWDPLDGDTQEALAAGRIAVDWREELGVFPRLAVRNLAFRNRGDGTFEEAGRRWGFGVEEDVSHAIASADLDRDGDLDVIITRLEGEPVLLRNDASGSRVFVRLSRDDGNTQAIGARVTLLGGALPEQTRQVTAGGMYLSGSDPALVFAMGTSASATLRVEWPDGAVTEVPVEADRAYEIRHPGAAGGAAPTPESPPARLFERVDVRVAHTESRFDELARQPLIPLGLSRAGPGVSWEDIDRDGDPDLIVAAPAGGRASVLMNEDGALEPAVPVGAAAPGDQTTVLGTVGPAGYTLVVGISSWEAASPAAAASLPSVLDLGASGGPLLEGDVSMTGPLAAADVDGDGDLDLFVGGRALPGAYPLPPRSRILRQGPEGWSEDPSPFASAGMVSGAVFSDVDSDGDPDLLLAVDWGPIRLFLNEGGMFREGTADWGLADLTGRWNGIATGDFDADGRPDLVVTGWGNNLDDPPTPGRPAVAVAGDFDANGQIDFIEARADGSRGAVPIRRFPELSTALPFIRRDVPTYAAFATSTVEDLLGGRPGDVYRLEAARSTHAVLLNLGDRFEEVALPPEVQRAPSFGVAVADLDRDGHEDLYLTQNYLSTPLGIPRHDAGRGAILLGDGAGGFRYVDSGDAGAPVYGDARGAALGDLDGDGRLDLAVGLNGEGAVVFRGVGGEPGLRVSLRGAAMNPEAIGAVVRVIYADSEGPAREVQAGSGYWSRDGAVQVFGLRAEPIAVEVRWPGTGATRTPLEPGQRSVTLSIGGS